MMKATALSLGVCFLVACATAHAQSCHPPASFYRTNAIRGTVQFAPGSGADCDLVSTVAANNSNTAGAFAWYNLPRPGQSLRISFRIDTSQLGDLQQIIDNVSILSASSPTPYPATDGVSNLLRLVVFPTDAESGPTLWALAACTLGSGYCSQEIESPLVDGDLLRFELTIGSGAAGILQWWVNADFSDPPTGTLDNLDNAAWQGVDTVALGAFQPTGAVAQNGTSLRFSDITTPDDEMFWNGFDY